MLVVFLPSDEPQHSPHSGATPPRRGPQKRELLAPIETRNTMPSPPPTVNVVPSTTIDWAAEAKGATSRQVEQDEETRGRAKAFAPPTSPMFAAAPAHKPAFHWNYARTHRVEALPGGVTVINLNDHCAVAFLWVLPFIGCQPGKIPIRGDLFDHMRDSPELGAWKSQ